MREGVWLGIPKCTGKKNNLELHEVAAKMGRGLIFFSDKANRFKGEERSSMLCKSRSEEEDDQTYKDGNDMFLESFGDLGRTRRDD
ncbi:hypothetical protein C1H46_038446 [Malus baccata]|uniref:Uncharacterized protein n=1 Tax=Malus baccata TaxID=106549 RepID=A0A540KP62_MALBA|nr:hypothetical protein C1H46_038446 [Malus baccata]